MQYGFIADNHITASSTFNDAYAPKYGRLHSIVTARGGGAWCSGVTDSNQYLQIDLTRVVTISGIATQGRQSRDSSKSWISEYKIWFKGGSSSFVEYKEFGNRKVEFFLFFSKSFFSFLSFLNFSFFFLLLFSFVLVFWFLSFAFLCPHIFLLFLLSCFLPSLLLT